MVLKGSKFRSWCEPSCDDRYVKLRKYFVYTGELVQEENELVLRRDVIFGNPSQAANVVLGLSKDGWEVWKKQFNIGSISDEIWNDFSLSSAKEYKDSRDGSHLDLAYYQEPENAYDVTKDSDWIDWTGSSKP
jgi:hypothetical protein